MTDSESRYHAKAVIEAAHALEIELHTKTGTTADWPYRITADNTTDAARLTNMLQSLRNALAPFRREPRILEALERSRTKL